MKSRSIAKNATLNVFKQCCNVLFPLILYLYVTRVLGASMLGKYSFANSIMSIAMTCAGLGVSTYTVREGARLRNNKEALTQYSSEVFTINVIAMIVALAVVCALMVFSPKIREVWVILAILCLNIVTNVFGRDWVNTLFEDFLYITIRYIAFQCIAIILILLFVKRPEDLLLYTCFMVVANGGGYFINIFYTQKYVPFRLTIHPNFKKHMKPLLYLFGVSLAIQIYIQLDITILGFLRSDYEVGVYTVVSKVYTITKSILNAVIMVVLPRLSFHLGQNDQSKYEGLLSKLRVTIFTLLPPFVLGMFCESKNILYLIGGQEYLEGVNTLKVLCIALSFAVFGCFYAQGVLVSKRDDKTFFIATITSAIANTALNFIAIPNFGMSGAALTTVVAEAIVFSICFIRSKKYVHLHDLTWFKTVITGSLAIIIICYGIRVLRLSMIPELFVAIVLCAIAYIGILFAFKNPVAVALADKIIKFR